MLMRIISTEKFLLTFTLFCIIALSNNKIYADQTVYLPIKADTHVYSPFPENNYGIITSADVYGPNTHKYAYYNFDISSLPTNATITSAYFSPYFIRRECADNTLAAKVNAYRITSSWLENYVNYANRPTYTTSNGSWFSNGPSSFSRYTEFNIKGLMTDWQANRSGSFGIALVYDSANSCNIKYATRESSTYPKPLLKVTYTTPLVILNFPNTQPSINPDLRVLDNTPPTISSITAYNIKNNNATIKWVTNEASDSYVTYGKSTTSLTTGNANMTTDHYVGLSGLESNTKYYYRVTSKDASGNSKSSEIKDFKTLPVLVEMPQGSTNSSDPISNVKTTILNSRDVETTWNTLDSGTSWVLINSSTFDDIPIYEYEIVHGRNDNVTSHSVVSDYLAPGSTYSYVVVTLLTTDASYIISPRYTFSLPSLGAFEGVPQELPGDSMSASQADELRGILRFILGSESSDAGTIGDIEVEEGNINNSTGESDSIAKENGAGTGSGTDPTGDIPTGTGSTQGSFFDIPTSGIGGLIATSILFGMPGIIGFLQFLILLIILVFILKKVFGKKKKTPMVSEVSTQTQAITKPNPEIPQEYRTPPKK